MVSLRDPFKGWNGDLQVGARKVTLNHLVCVFEDRATQSGTRVPLGCARAPKPADVIGVSGDDGSVVGDLPSQVGDLLI